MGQRGGSSKPPEPPLDPPLGNCSKISNTILFLFLTKMLAIRAEIHKMPVQSSEARHWLEQSDLGLCYLSRPLCQQLVLEILEHLQYSDTETS